MTTEEKIIGIVAEHLMVNPGQVFSDSKLKDDLGAGTLDLAGLIMALEESFDCEIADEHAEKIVTVQDIFDYAESNGLKA